MNQPPTKSYGKPQGVRSQKHGSKHGGFAPSIKNSAIHVKKVSVPSIKAMGTSNPDTIAPGSATNTKFAPKSNLKRMGYKNASKQMN